ncbi:hypothetical protein QJS10_CPB20g00596 [Acorus calamus]|uniref:AAA+ ATPase domain-containing protein n=1 Tax=Acorus calamus TaxID=4465 RepID=A0AAV9C9Z9_ACOCL|nr:hypothetical protein QJS10_CPB20g00596 [Acorus calamus]
MEERFKKCIWRKTLPKGLKIQKYIEGPGGVPIHDNTYVGENAWDDDLEASQNDVTKIIESDTRFNEEQKKALKVNLGIGVENREGGSTWRERLATWKEILRRDELSEKIESLNSKYIVDFDMNEVENCLRKEVAERVSDIKGSRALWISKRWWRYRPRLPYTYFINKLDCSEVAAVVFSEDLKKLYVTMKEGFPLEYTVDIPLDPYLFEKITVSGAEVDLLQKRQINYFMRVVVALAPGLLILWLIRESVMLLHITSNRYLYKKYNQLFDLAYAENFILPVGMTDRTKSMYKEVVLGGDVWELLDELMIYMGNPMQYYEKQVQFVRGVLLSGPPGTGKTLFARTLAKESGMPFVFASAAEFTDSEKSGAARRNAPSFVFVDEIDAIAGRHARKDPRRRAAFNALISQLDGEKEKIGVDRFSLRQAVIFICATNRPDELDEEFVHSGRIDRRLYIGLPDAKQRVQIFHVHSAGKKLADDVEFDKLVFRTVGYSGADIRNLVNESAIMSVRREHSKITQKDIIDVLDKQLLEGMGVLLTEEEQQKCEESVSRETKRLLAVHEAGHILLAHLFPRFDWHAFSQLLPGGKIAREMVISPRNSRLGLTTLVKRVGSMDQPDNTDGELMKYKWDDPKVIPANMTPEVSEMFTRELTRYIEETEDLAMSGLKQNMHILDVIARELVENSRITGLEVEQRMQQLSPMMLEDLVVPFQINLNEEGPLPVNSKLRYQPLISILPLFTGVETKYMPNTSQITALLHHRDEDASGKVTLFGGFSHLA